MVRLGRSLGRGLGRGLAAPRFQGIRFRMGMAMAVALAPILILSAVQTVNDFRRQAEDRRTDLTLAAERSAAAAKSRLDGAAVLLQALRPETLGPFCGPRLTGLIERLDGYSGLVRYSATGVATCASDPRPTAAAWQRQAGRDPWFTRLRLGEPMTVARAPDGATNGPALIAAIRLERPLGAFDGSMAAIIPLSALQPDT
ncbi:MAG: sensor histidine kinase, partial [Brevundimonas sp.]|nr:sensor histidine kinase [Brevundimonas sp.]